MKGTLIFGDGDMEEVMQMMIDGTTRLRDSFSLFQLIKSQVD